MHLAEAAVALVLASSQPNPSLQPTGTPSACLPSLRCAQFGAAELQRYAA